MWIEIEIDLAAGFSDGEVGRALKLMGLHWARLALVIHLALDLEQQSVVL
jgi:hypothetical protein